MWQLLNGIPKYTANTITSYSNCCVGCSYYTSQEATREGEEVSYNDLPLKPIEVLFDVFYTLIFCVGVAIIINFVGFVLSRGTL